jgi:hypothetical protein
MIDNPHEHKNKADVGTRDPHAVSYASGLECQRNQTIFVIVTVIQLARNDTGSHIDRSRPACRTCGCQPDAFPRCWIFQRLADSLNRRIVAVAGSTLPELTRRIPTSARPTASRILPLCQLKIPCLQDGRITTLFWLFPYRLEGNPRNTLEFSCYFESRVFTHMQIGTVIAQLQ